MSTVLLQGRMAMLVMPTLERLGCLSLTDTVRPTLRRQSASPTGTIEVKPR